MSSYTITMMTWKQGGLIPKIINARNTKVYMENILGGDVSIIAKDVPIKGTMIMGGPEGKEGLMAIVKNMRGHWAGLTKEQQKQVMAWFLSNPGRSL
jgi:hypothetical protein